MNLKQLLLVCLFFPLCGIAQTIQKPTIKSKTSFAIVIDSNSYAHARKAVDAYRSCIERDGLGTYLCVNSWKSPEEIREHLIRFHKDSKYPLEGAVFIGDIPIPMLRDAQHLSSAFKMDQNRNWKQSSIPSDRYYDDFNLQFSFLKQDADQPLYYYYSLKPESKQYLSPDIYTARIKPIELEGTDKYKLLSDYLNKVVKERTENPDNRIDNLTMARGHGYNSEDETAWAGEQLALKEQLTSVFAAGNRVKFMDFESRFPMKNYFLNEIQNPELDIMLFHHHGASDTQYINGYENGSSPSLCIKNLKLYLRGKVLSMAKKKGKEEAIKSYMDQFGVSRAWCEEAFDEQKQKEDSLFNLTLDIHTQDIHSITPNARFVMFDACYNGSFYEKDYIAGAYLFNKGKTIVTQGNTVNTIQDKWPDEMIGLLNAGLRIGEWHRYVCFLETHLLGDPTYHFANTSGLGYDVNEASMLHDRDSKFWIKRLDSPLPDMQCLALRKLKGCDIKDYSSLLKKKYFTSPYGVVRLEAMRLLVLLDNSDTIEVLKTAMDDSYELVRRFAAEYTAKNGSDELIPAFAAAYLNHSTERRMMFKLTESVKTLNLDLLKQELNKQVAQRPFYNKNNVDNMYRLIERGVVSEKESRKTIMDTTSKTKYKHLEIVSYRNHPSAKIIESLLLFIKDPTRDLNLRISAAEALGWFNLSYRKNQIINSLEETKENITEEKLKDEITKSIRRLSFM